MDLDRSAAARKNKIKKADVQASLFVSYQPSFKTRRIQLYSRRNSGAVGYRCEGVGWFARNNYNKRRLGFETNNKNLANKVTSQ